MKQLKLYKHISRKKKPQRVRLLVGLSLFTMVVAIALVLFQTYDEYQRSFMKGQQEAARLTTIISDNLEHSVQTTDLLLQHAVERQHLNLLFGGKLPQDMVHNFKLWVDSSPHIVAMMLINDKGQTEVAVNNKGFSRWIDYNMDLREFPPFRLLKRDTSENKILIPYLSKGKNAHQVVMMARRLTKLDGSFGGIVVAAINPEYYLNFFASVDTRELRYLDVMIGDGQSMFHAIEHKRLWHGNQSLWEQIKRQQLSHKEGAMVYQQDDRTMILAYQKLMQLPITTIVAIDEEEFLYDFWRDRFKDLSFLLLFVVFGSVGSFFMITMAKQVMRVEQSESAAILASQAKSEFLANMSHELRTPLNAIIGFSEMMTAGYFGPLNTKQKERMGDITLCGNHLLQLINDILEFSKGEAGRLEIVEEKVSVKEIIDESIRIMNEKVKTKGVKVAVDVLEQLPMLFADKRKLKQILINLLSNAVKFTPPNGSISMVARLESNGNMVIEVSDTGIGIAEEDIPTALAVFGQVHRSQSHEGTGLGLPLCRMFTELHGGTLTLISTLGEGTTVRLRFPAARVIVAEENAA